MIDAYLAAMRRYAVLHGRASRSDYWWFYLAVSVLVLVALGMDTILVADPENEGAPLTFFVVLAHVLPLLAAGVRRLHDMDRSGWLYLIALVPVVGPVVLLVWYCRPGTPGANGFGPDPLATVSVPAERGRPIAAAARDVVAEIERLAGLRASGALSEAEFTTLKARAVAASAPT